MRLFESPTLNFIPNRRRGYLFSGTLIVLSLISLMTLGLETGIDFRGGTEFVVEADQEIDVVAIRGPLSQTLGTEPETKLFGSPHEVLVRTTLLPTPEQDVQHIQRRVLDGIAMQYPDAEMAVIKSDAVGPRFADELRRAAIYAVLAALLVIFIYILLRFGQILPLRWDNAAYPLGAVAALAHDVTITLGLFSMLHLIVPFSLQIDQAIIAALLTIVGYSLNDTVVVFDRIREYTNIFKTDPFDDVVNRSINATLSRTVVTSLTTLLVVTVLFIFGGEVLRGFAFALIIGVVIGTYSSIFVASPVVVEVRQRALARAAAQR